MLRNHHYPANAPQTTNLLWLLEAHLRSGGINASALQIKDLAGLVWELIEEVTSGTLTEGEIEIAASLVATHPKAVSAQHVDLQEGGIL